MGQVLGAGQRQAFGQGIQQPAEPQSAHQILKLGGDLNAL
jgi:hypothetical protein